MFIPCPGVGTDTGTSIFLGVTTGGVTPDTADAMFTDVGRGLNVVDEGLGAAAGVCPGILAPGN